jgi:hypothetical protein
MTKARPLACIIASAFTIVAGIILVIGASIFIKDTNYIHNLWTQIYTFSIISVVIGALAIVFGIGLAYVVNRQFPALTTLLSGLLVFVAFFATICAVILITGRMDFEEKSFNHTKQLFLNYSDSDSVISSKLIVEQVQQSFECCGVDQATYWKDRYTDQISTPDSCCKKMVTNCGKHALDKDTKTIYLRGCAEPLYIHLRKEYTVLIGMNFAVTVLALISAILGVIYERHIREQYQSM